MKQQSVRENQKQMNERLSDTNMETKVKEILHHVKLARRT